MNKLIRLYNQNRGLAIAIIFIIALIIIIIQILNSIAGKKTEEKRNLIANQTNSSTIKDSTTISPSNVSAITGETVKSNVSDKEIIKKFVEYCNKKETDLAYDMLSEDCKARVFSNSQRFEDLYINRIFYMDRMYTLENWFETNSFTTYYIKYMEDILASGNANSNSNMSDYITVTRDGKLNINSFVGTKKVNMSQSAYGVEIKLNKIYLYMDYLIADIDVTNNTDKTIMLDTKEGLENTYLYDTKGVKYIAFLNENSGESLKVRRNRTESVNIKFNKIYNPESRTLNGLIFKDVTLNYDEYNEKIEDKVNVKIDIKI